MKLHHIVLIAIGFVILGTFYSMATMPKAESAPLPDPIPTITVEQHEHLMICQEFNIRCELRADKTFPCVSPYGDTLRGNLLIENPKSCK